MIDREQWSPLEVDEASSDNAGPSSGRPNIGAGSAVSIRKTCAAITPCGGPSARRARLTGVSCHRLEEGRPHRG